MNRLIIYTFWKEINLKKNLQKTPSPQENISEVQVTSHVKTIEENTKVSHSQGDRENQCG